MEDLSQLLKGFSYSLAKASKRRNLQHKEFRFLLKCAILKVKVLRLSSCTPHNSFNLSGFQILYKMPRPTVQHHVSVLSVLLFISKFGQS